VEGRAGKGAMVNSSSVLVRSARPRLASLLQLTILAYNTEGEEEQEDGAYSHADNDPGVFVGSISIPDRGLVLLSQGKPSSASET
jgi:hypothetical protein